MCSLQAEADEEPLHVGAVLLSPEAQAQVEECWQLQARAGRSLYASAGEWVDLVKQVGVAGAGWHMLTLK
jgi:hypothetical protein